MNNYNIYKLDGTPLTNDDIKKYIDNTVDRIFAILITYEECSELNNYENYKTYLKRLIIEFTGMYHLLKAPDYMSIVGILIGLLEMDDLTHTDVKSSTFHCISVLKKNR